MLRICSQILCGTTREDFLIPTGHFCKNSPHISVILFCFAVKKKSVAAVVMVGGNIFGSQRENEVYVTGSRHTTELKLLDINNQ